MKITGSNIVEAFEQLGISHVIWIPDSETGRWEAALEAAAHLQLVRVCREGEAWPLAAGLMIGGQLPIIVMQSTGLFESGDALRNVVFDLQLPVYALVGVRSAMDEASHDSAKRFAEPAVHTWGLDYLWLCSKDDLPKLVEHFRRCRSTNRPGIALLAEGGAS